MNTCNVFVFTAVHARVIRACDFFSGVCKFFWRYILMHVKLKLQNSRWWDAVCCRNYPFWGDQWATTESSTWAHGNLKNTKNNMIASSSLRHRHRHHSSQSWDSNSKGLDWSKCEIFTLLIITIGWDWRNNISRWTNLPRPRPRPCIIPVHHTAIVDWRYPTRTWAMIKISTPVQITICLGISKKWRKFYSVSNCKRFYCNAIKNKCELRFQHLHQHFGRSNENRLQNNNSYRGPQVPTPTSFTRRFCLWWRWRRVRS